MTPASPQPQREPHVRWFGRDDDDPNRLLIIEDDHCRVFLDAEARAELYSVIESTRPHTRAPDDKDWWKKTGIAPDEKALQQIPWIYEHDAAIRKDATLAAEQTENILAVLKKRYKTEPAILDYVEMIECEVMELRQSTTAGDEQHE
jgi:hypothetical protein